MIFLQKAALPTAPCRLSKMLRKLFIQCTVGLTFFLDLRDSISHPFDLVTGRDLLALRMVKVKGHATDLMLLDGRGGAHKFG